MTQDDFDKALIAATQDGLPLVSRPYEAVGAMLGVSGEHVRARLAQWLAQGQISRIGASAQASAPADTTGSLQALSVWDVDEDQLPALGMRLATLPAVSQCSSHPRQNNLWPYNLHVTVHGKSRQAIAMQVEKIRQSLGNVCHGHEVLYTSATLKTPR